jgi:DNA-directed RNA polymerase specialized sigma54-like protein
MKSSIVAKLEALYERHEEVQALLGDLLHLTPVGIAARHIAQLSILPRQRAEFILIGNRRG